MTRTALVTGAAGFIGGALVRHLLDRGYEVRALVRAEPHRAILPRSALVYGDVAVRESLEAAVQGVDVIFHLAALLHVNDPTPALEAEYRRVNVEGTRNVVEQARLAGVGRLVFFSTINVYGPTRQGQVFDESSPLRPDSWYAKTKAEGERIALDSMPAVVLRLAAVYGPSMKGNYLQLLRALRRGPLPIVGDGKNRRTLVHVSDACAAALLAAEHPRSVGSVYNVTDGEVHTLAEIIRAMSRALEKPPPRLHLPARPVRIAAGLLEDGLRACSMRSPIGRATVDKFTEDVAVSGDKMRRDLGYAPQFDLARGWRDTVVAWSRPT